MVSKGGFTGRCGLIINPMIGSPDAKPQKGLLGSISPVPEPNFPAPRM
jgi:hypothetical protein